MYDPRWKLLFCLIKGLSLSFLVFCCLFSATFFCEFRIVGVLVEDWYWYFKASFLNYLTSLIYIEEPIDLLLAMMDLAPVPPLFFLEWN